MVIAALFPVYIRENLVKLYAFIDLQLPINTIKSYLKLQNLVEKCEHMYYNKIY